MILQLKQHLRREKNASLWSLAKQFDVDIPLMRDMLDCWIRKGKLRRCAKSCNTGSSSCQKCASNNKPSLNESYEWVG